MDARYGRGQVVMERVPFTRLAREQIPWLYVLARRLAGEAAEDVVQECLVKAYRSYDGLRDPEAAAAWLRSILVNCARDRYRREATGIDETPLDDVPETSLYRRIADEDPWPYSDTVHVDFLHSFTEEHVWQVLDRLQPKYRVPLVLVHMEGLEVSAVARMLGAPRNTVLSWLRRGRQQFEDQLWEFAEANGLLDGKGVSE